MSQQSGTAHAPSGPVGTGSGRRYDAFLSYSQHDVALARELQSLLSKLAKPWYRRRSLRVFRDETSLPAGSRLWEPIERAMAASEFYVLLASPSAAASTWVERELAWWLEHRGADSVILIVADGEIAWDEGSRGFDRSRTTCLPPSAVDCFGEEPHWIDVRSVSDTSNADHLTPFVASVMAAITGRDKDDLIGEDLRQHRRVKRIAISVAALLSVLAVLLALVAVAAIREKQRAQRNERIAEAHAKAAQSQALLAGRLDKAILAARLSYQMEPDFTTRAAMLRALTRDPHLVRFFTVPKTVKALAWAGSSGRLVVGGSGYLMVADPLTGEVRDLDVPDVAAAGPVSAVAASPDGGAVAAGTTRGRVTFSGPAATWTVEPFTGQGSPTAEAVAAVAVDPAHRAVYAVSTNGKVVSLDLSSGRPTRSPVQLSLHDTSYLTLVDDSASLLIGTSSGRSVIEPTSGSWQPDPTPSGDPERGTLQAYASDGKQVTYSYVDHGHLNRAVVYSSSGQTGPIGGAVPTQSTSLATTADGATVATEHRGLLAIHDIAGEHLANPITLPGAASLHALLQFSPNGAELASASGTSIGIWQSRGLAGIARTVPTRVPNPYRLMHPWSVVADDTTDTVVTIVGRGHEGSALQCWRGGTAAGLTPLPGMYASSMSWADNRAALLVGVDSKQDGQKGWSVLDVRVERGCPTTDWKASDPVGPGFAADPASGRSQRPIRPATVRPIAGGGALVATSDGDLVYVGPDGTPRAVSTGHAVTALAVAPSLDTAVVGLKNGELVGYRVSQGQIQPFTIANEGGHIHEAVNAVVFVNDSTVAFVRKAGGVFVQALTGSALSLPSALAFNIGSAGDDLLVGVEPGHVAVVWDIAHRQLLGTFHFAPPAGDEYAQDAPPNRDQAAATVVVGDGSGGLWLGVPTASLTWWKLDTATLAARSCADVATLAARYTARHGLEDPCHS